MTDKRADQRRLPRPVGVNVGVGGRGKRRVDQSTEEESPTAKITDGESASSSIGSNDIGPEQIVGGVQAVLHFRPDNPDDVAAGVEDNYGEGRVTLLLEGGLSWRAAPIGE